MAPTLSHLVADDKTILWRKKTLAVQMETNDPSRGEKVNAPRNAAHNNNYDY